MKRFFALLFVSLFMFQLVYADDYTTDVFENRRVENIEKRYKWYKKEYKYIGVMERISSTDYYQDLDNCEVSYSSYKKYNDQTLDENYEISDMYELYQAKKVQYVMLKYKIIPSGKEINISEIEMKDNDNNKIDYEVHDFINCYKATLDYLNDGIADEDNKAKIRSGGYIILKLNKAYDINNINIKLYINSPNSDTKSLEFYFCPTESNSYKTYSKKEIDYSYIIRKDEREDTIVDVKVDDSWDNNFEYDLVDFYKEIDEENVSLTSYYKEQKYYRRVTKKYPTYIINKKYLDGYYHDLNLDGYYKDLDNYKLYYKYSNQEVKMIPTSKSNIDNFSYIINNQDSNDTDINNKNGVVLLNKANTKKDVNTDNNCDTNKTAYKYITKYKIKYKYVNIITVISILLNILFIMYLIYKRLKNNN